MNQELYILLGDKCNFSCAHCLNSSGPKANRWRISKNEISDLAQIINGTSTIKQVHFSGGEPSLFMSEMEDLQRQVNRTDLTWAMTSNGWFGHKHNDFLKSLSIDKIFLSFDRYHLPFISEEELLKSALHLKSQGIEIELLFVFESATDLLLTKRFKENNIPIQFSQIVVSGRHQDDPKLQKGEQLTCPSLEDRKLEKVNYIPGQGFSPCCGPLAFDELVPADLLYSKSWEDYQNNHLKKQLVSEEFRNKFKSSDKTICHFCTEYFS